MSSRLTVYSVFSLVLAGGLCDVTVAQQPKAAINDFVVIPLKHTSAESIAAVLHQAFCGEKTPVVRIIPEARTNSILVSAPGADLTSLRDLIAKLDVAARDAGDTSRFTLRVFKLRHLNLDKSLENSLRLAMSGSPNSRVSLDPGRRQVLAYADEAAHKDLEALLANLDVLPPTATSGDVQVRVVWLVSGPAAENAPATPPPDDLKDVLPGLAKLGIDKPRLAAHTLVSVRSNSRFETKGVAKLDGPCQFTVSGQFDDKKPSPTLSISIRAARSQGNTTDMNIGNIQTEISAPLGHFVVLGVTPTDALTSVFVVQVVSPGEKPPR